MSDDVGADVRRDLAKANEAYAFFQSSLAAHQAHVSRYRWDEADKERERLHAHLDDYLDHMGAAQKRLETERPK